MARVMFFVLLVLSLLPSYQAGAKNSEQLAIGVQQCREIGSRIDRLACFDQLFNVQPQAEILATQRTDNHSPSWRRAQESESFRDTQDGFLINYVNAQVPEAGIWLTVAEPGGAVFMISCIDRITRVELVLPQPVKLAKIPVQVQLVHNRDQIWLVDDDDVVIRSGRGIPSIELAKQLLTLSSIKINSKINAIDGLVFSTKNLNESILPLRRTCGW